MANINPKQADRIGRRSMLFGAAPTIAAASLALDAVAQTPTPGDPLAAWNDGPAKQAILDFVRATTDPSSKTFVAPEDRIATFDQDGTLWVEHPVYTQAMFALDRVHVAAPQHPEWRNREPFKAVLANDMAAIAKFSEPFCESLRTEALACSVQQNRGRSAIRIKLFDRRVAIADFQNLDRRLPRDALCVIVNHGPQFRAPRLPEHEQANFHFNPYFLRFSSSVLRLMPSASAARLMR